MQFSSSSSTSEITKENTPECKIHPLRDACKRRGRVAGLAFFSQSSLDASIPTLKFASISDALVSSTVGLVKFGSGATALSVRQKTEARTLNYACNLDLRQGVESGKCLPRFRNMLSKADLRFVFLFLNLFSLYKGISSLKSMVIKVPEAVKSGDTVTLTCEYDLENVALYSIKWYWNDEEFYRYIPKESPPFKAFPVKLVNVDLSKSGENAVTLRGVHRQLTGDYKCEVSADGPLFHTDILGARMIVAELPHDDPIMSLRDTKVEIGKKVQVECFSASSDPAANLTWFINNKEVSSHTYCLGTSININYISSKFEKVGLKSSNKTTSSNSNNILTLK
ncbi:hypothetical protein GWI33_020973 [Rhynchophorus ferrugineus]|uniref:Ig-like domain-containing protein n=1 Tax=Rhynchophorus ferrugineus TaxID=354439 RepID=A0A834M3P4_RHYFE|nr:hypothetical protein GWI33_020973 [Rhynchophorus ferrugineus]